MTQLAFTWPGEEPHLDMNGADLDQVRDMDRRLGKCRVFGHHAPHTIERDGETFTCPGIVNRMCGREGLHDHHRWAQPDAFYWCQPFDYLVAAGAPVNPGMVRSVSVDSLSRRS